jgi:hypothetical protein
LPAYLLVPPHPLDQILSVVFRSEDFGHCSIRSTVILQQFFETILRLGVANGVRCVFERPGEDVRYSEFISIDRRALSLRLDQKTPRSECSRK